MILDSMKTRGFYAFFNGMKFSGTLGLYLVALFMCLGECVWSQVLIPSYVQATHSNATSSDRVSLQSQNSGCLKISQPATDPWKYQNASKVYTEEGVEIETLRNSYDPYGNGNPQGTGYFYYDGSKWNYSIDVNNCQNSQDPNGGGGCNKPTINTNSIQNVSAGTTLSQITISVNDNGNAITGHPWKVNGANQNDNYVLQAGQTYNLTYEVTNGCGTSSKNYEVTIPSGGSSSYHIKCTSGSYYGQTIPLSENSGCYYTTSTTPMFYSEWHLEDSGNNTIPLKSEFTFDVWGHSGHVYGVEVP